MISTAPQPSRQMVCVYGMSDSVGLARCAQRPGGMYLPSGTDGALQRDCSEETAREIDSEVKRILDTAYADAKRILEDHRDQLERITGELLKCETMDAATFNRLIGH